jgi:hypothetical protein
VCKREKAAQPVKGPIENISSPLSLSEHREYLAMFPPIEKDAINSMPNRNPDILAAISLILNCASAEPDLISTDSTARIEVRPKEGVPRTLSVAAGMR